jgi:ribosomal protein L16 Arg81 hydroxylase
MYLYDNKHPSGRHSEVDWSDPDLQKFPKFAQLKANEVILKPGDVLYVPTHWFHYIVSLNVNWQCNSRSGRSLKYSKAVAKCGF